MSKIMIIRQNDLITKFIIGLQILILMVALTWNVEAAGEGMKIKIRAENKSTTDRPFCGIGGGMIGDSLVVDVYTNLFGVTTGTATFTPADSSAIILNIDTVLTFTTGGIVLLDSSNDYSVAIWLDEANAPNHVNVELPRNCTNTQSTFTAGVDRLRTMISIR